jgi:pyruvate kinase
MIFQKSRRTKTIWSFESNVLSADLAKTVIAEDFDALRIVYGQGSGEKIAEFISAVKAQKPPDRTIPIMLDVPTQVRAIVDPSSAPVEVKYGDLKTIGLSAKSADISIQTDHFKELLVEGATVYFSYGYAEALVKSVSGDKAHLEIVQGGIIHPGMEVHVPTTRAAPLMEHFDLKDLSKVLKLTIDYFVMPGFVSSTEIQKFIAAVESLCDVKPWFILKVNSSDVYRKLGDLLEHVHGVLISRLELALVMEPAMVPVVTKEIIQLCNDKSRISLIASEMLGSMRTNPTPTRAEVSDIANAVADGADAVVLTEDIPYGANAARAIALMAKIIEDVESKRELLPNWSRQDPHIVEEMDAVAYAAYRTAKRVDAKAIVCLTKEGNTAVKLASFRTTIPIIAVTFSRDVLRRLSLVGGVSGVLLEADPVIDQVLPVVNDLLKRASSLQVGDRIVFVSVTLSSLSRSESNLFTVQTIS